MRLELELLFAAGVGYLIVLFLVAYATERGIIPARLASHPLTSALALGVFASSWSFNGSVGFARTEGYRFLTIYLGVTLACLLMPLVWKPIARLTREYQLTSLADLFVYRYRGQLVGVLVTLFMLAGSLPYLALEIRAITESVAVLAHGAKPVVIGLGFCLTLTLFAILFGARHPTSRERHEGLVVAIAFESLVKLGALLAVGGFAIFGVFDGTGHMGSWLAEHPESLEALYRPAREGPWATLLLLSFAAAFLLPRQFHIAFTESPGEEALTTAGWALPLYLLVLNLPIVPILLAGTLLKPRANPDFYVLGITLAGRSNVLSVMAFVGGLAAASGTVIVTTLALASMSLNHLLLPLRPPRQARDLYRSLLWARRALIAGIILSGFAFFLLLEKRLGLAELGLVSFVAVAQFLPGLVGLLFWPRASRAGFVAGLCAGIVVWAATLAVPLLGGSNLTDATLEVSQRLGIAPSDPWSYSTFLSLAANALLFAAGSVFLPDRAEAGTEAPALVVGASSPSDFQSRLTPILGGAAEVEVQRALGDLMMRLDERRPVELRLLRDRIERNLSGLMGPRLARMVVDESLRMDPSARTALADQLRLLEQRLNETRIPLRGAAAELETFQRYFRQILEDLPQGVCALGPDSDVVIWNRAMARLTGIERDDAVGLPVANVAAPWGTLLGSFARGTSNRREQRLTMSSRERFLQLHKSQLEASVSPDAPLSSNLAGGQVIVVEDLTEAKSLQAQLAHQDRLASVGRLAAGVAHEIGNPLTGIACVAQNLVYETDAKAIEERAELIVEQTRRIDRILQSLVSFSHAGAEALPARASPAAAPFELAGAVEEAVQLVRLSRQARKVECENLCGDGLLIEGDRQQLIQVFVNLLTNACDASESGDRVEVSAAVQDGFMRVEVRDNGEGIPDDVRDRIFDPFFTTKVPGEGTGLGLSLVYSIVREHRGFVEVQSQEGSGTTVSVLLPRVTS
jgi:PAS domain S-box-containing protein